MLDPALLALRHVAASATGKALDPTLRVTLNFHPDRLVDGLTVLERLARDDLYRSQFETGTSNGGLTAHPGGDRWAWESRIFGGAYDQAPAAARPKYGALNFRCSAVGAAPRFGSAHLRLKPAVLSRTTFCYPDSVFEPEHFGVAERFNLIELALTDDQDALDEYIEAHVHGPLLLSREVEAVVLDPSFRGTAVEQSAAMLPCPVEWHAGFRLNSDDLQRWPEYRGPEIVRLGQAIAEDGWLTPRILGTAYQSGQYDEQALKRVWHLLARFGHPELEENHDH